MTISILVALALGLSFYFSVLAIPKAPSPERTVAPNVSIPIPFWRAPAYVEAGWRIRWEPPMTYQPIQYITGRNDFPPEKGWWRWQYLVMAQHR